MKAVEAASGFRFSTENRLKRVPTGFPADSEYADLLKMKDFYIEKPIGNLSLGTDDLLDYALEEFRRTQPFIAQINRAVAYAYEEMR